MPSSRKPMLSIVAPAFNEQDCLPAFHEELMRVLTTLQDEFDLEIVYVDDGSEDATPAVLTRMALTILACGSPPQPEFRAPGG